MKHYETTAGYVTRADHYSKLMELLREAEDTCYIIAHLHRTETSKREELLATGWRGVGQMLAMTRTKILEFAKSSIQ